MLQSEMYRKDGGGGDPEGEGHIGSIEPGQCQVSLAEVISARDPSVPPLKLFVHNVTYLTSCNC